MRKATLPKKAIISFAKQLLSAMAETYVDLVKMNRRWHSFDYAMHPEYYRAKDRDRLERQQRRALRTLQRSKMLEIRKKGEKIFFSLTEKGRRCILERQLDAAPQCQQGECIMIIFDIPETESSFRRYLRRFLSEHHFHQLQRSVWMSERDVFRPLQEFIRVSDAQPWVDIFRVHRS